MIYFVYYLFLVGSVFHFYLVYSFLIFLVRKYGK